MIYPDPPSDWQDLEDRVCRIFKEIGCATARGEKVSTVRGKIAVDVVVHDETRRPHTLILCECKHWKRKIPKSVVHAFRSVVQDAGAHLGFIIADAGFQPGALEAAFKANIRLVTWAEFQAEMYDRWLAAMGAKLGAWADEVYRLAYPDVESRTSYLIDQAIKVSGEDGWSEYEALRERHPQYWVIAPSAKGDPTAYVPSASGGRQWNGHHGMYFSSPREYFDKLIACAPPAYAGYISRHVQGRFGCAGVFDEDRLSQLRVGSTTADVHRLLGYHAHVQTVPHDGERWSIRGSITSFSPNDETKGNTERLLFAETRRRVVKIDFGPDGVAREVSVEDDRYFGHP